VVKEALKRRWIIGKIVALDVILVIVLSVWENNILILLLKLFNEILKSTKISYE